MDSASSWGILFEILLFGIPALLPEDSLAGTLIYNFGIQSHNMLDAFFAGNVLFVLLASVSIWSLMAYFLLRLAASASNRLGLTTRQKALAVAIPFFAGLLLLGWGIWEGSDVTPANSVPFTATPEANALIQSNAAFAIDLYQKLKEREGNLFFAPHSISVGLAMIYAGARGPTERELAAALHFGLPQEKIAAAYGILSRRLEAVQGANRVTLTSANSIWRQQGHPFLQPFLKCVRDSYGGEAGLLDFKNAAQAAGEINTWVERHTAGNIKDVVRAGDFDSSSQLVLCDAMYFKGKWRHVFKTADTRPAPFYISEERDVTVPMMSQKAEFKAYMIEGGDDPGMLSLLELPYRGGDLSMIILLPWQRDGLSDLEKRLTPENLTSWLGQLDKSNTHEINVRLPRFKTSTEIELEKELRSPGMNTLFGSKADLSGIDGTKDLYVSKVTHKAEVEVDEQGTMARAILVIHAKSKSQTTSINCDHPFLYLIRDNASGEILFMGRMVDPSK